MYTFSHLDSILKGRYHYSKNNILALFVKLLKLRLKLVLTVNVKNVFELLIKNV